ncbi:CHASE2 domain-containing protein [Nostoc calcicola FACHB-3891]|nr:CHASE2 domain-containing protein [Nostoc calcicola FACHB-3891]
MSLLVIIGVVAPISNPTDYFSTPYSKGVLPRMSGVDIQAQMTSQILSAVLDKRPLLSSLSEIGEGVWVVIWSLAGSGIAIASLSNRNSFLLFLYTGMCIFILSLICFVFLLQGTWIPLVPSAISLFINSLSGWLLLKHWSQIANLKILQNKNNT